MLRNTKFAKFVIGKTIPFRKDIRLGRAVPTKCLLSKL